MSISEEYKATKGKYAGEILLFQAGIFYRIMFEDAKRTSDVLGLKLRVEGDADAPLCFCGFPKSGLDKYIGKLVRAGFSVAVCSQVRSGDGEVRREVGEVIRCSKTL
jgi:DNA mismatch repair protein MutS